MAEKRMIAKTIIDSDAFLDMPQTTQNLYFHLNIRADDEGFINNPKKIMRMVSSNQNDLEILLSKKYVLAFDSGVIVIKHWKLHNSIRKDRVKETVYTEEKEQLTEKENGVYTDTKTPMLTNDNQESTKSQASIVKSRLDKNSIVKSSKDIKHKYGEYKNVLLKDSELDKLKDKFQDYEARIKNLDEGIELKGYKYKSHYLAILKWSEKEKPTGKMITEFEEVTW